LSTKSVTLSALVSAVAAFGVGALAFNGQDAAAPSPVTRPDTAKGAEAAPDTATTPDTEPVAATPKVATATPSATATDTAAKGKGHGHGQAAKPKATKSAKSKGPKGLVDRDGDGKMLDDIGRTVVPNMPKPDVPDELIPFPGQDPEEYQDLPDGVVKADPTAVYADPDAGTDPATHVVAAPAIHDRPVNTAPVTSTWGDRGPVMTGGPVAVEPVVAGGPVAVRPGPAVGVVSAVPGGRS
jgi:hypothetical protein